MSVNQKERSRINSRVNSRRVTKKSYCYQVIAEEVSSSRRQKVVKDVLCPSLRGRREGTQVRHLPDHKPLKIVFCPF